MDYITPERYAENVDARCSNEYHDNIHIVAIADLLLKFGFAAEALDGVKKALFYNKMGDEERALSDSINAMRPRPEGCEDVKKYFGCYHDGNEPIILSDAQINLFHAIIGIATEAGELVGAFIDGLAAAQSRTKPLDDAFDHINMREEFGDVLWYVQLGLNSIHSNMPECMTINDNKLERRYGPAFSSDRANDRDLDAERKELEG